MLRFRTRRKASLPSGNSHAGNKESPRKTTFMGEHVFPLFFPRIGELGIGCPVRFCSTPRLHKVKGLHEQQVKDEAPLFLPGSLPAHHISSPNFGRGWADWWVVFSSPQKKRSNTGNGDFHGSKSPPGIPSSRRGKFTRGVLWAGGRYWGGVPISGFKRSKPPIPPIPDPAHQKKTEMGPSCWKSETGSFVSSGV